MYTCTVWALSNEKEILKWPYREALLHNFRRKAGRNLGRASVPEKIAMTITGHKTLAVFDRYNIVNVQALMEAGHKMVELQEQQVSVRSRGHLVETSKKRKA